MARKKVVIVGGGFAGLNAALGLSGADVDLTLADRRNFHLFQPLLYQVATGALSPGDISAPLRHVLRRQGNTTVVMDEVIDIDPAGRKLILRHSSLPYDYLIIAAGARNFYFGNDAWQAPAPALKSIEDATGIRGRIFSAFERAEAEEDEAARRAWLRFAVVGAGPTGAELAGALGEIARDTLRGNFRRIRPEEAEVLILEGSDRVLPAFPPDLSAKAEKALIRLGVRPRLGVRVTGIDAEGVTFTGPRGEERLECRTVIWAAGVRPSPLAAIAAAKFGAATDKSGRVITAADLSIPGHPEVFVAGDMACFEQDGAALPGVAPVAIQQGQYLAKAIGARAAGQTAPPFRYVNKGNMATLGRASAVADLGFARFGGLLAWLTWLFIHLLYLVGFQNRVLVATQWAFQYLTLNRGARLITGEPPSPEAP